MLQTLCFQEQGEGEGVPNTLQFPNRESSEKTNAVNRSVWKGIVNPPKTLASRQPVPVIPKLARILDEYRASLHNPAIGVMFHTGSGNRMDMDKLAQRVIRPTIKAIGLPWYGWHSFRRGIASNLYELGANEKVVQRVLRHANPHVTKDRYIKNI